MSDPKLTEAQALVADWYGRWAGGHATLDDLARMIAAAEQTARAEERAKVAELHPRITLPHHHQPSPLFPDRCATCWDDGGYAAWPCPTMRAIEATP